MPEYLPDSSPYILWLDRPDQQAEDNLTVLTAKSTTSTEIRAETRGLRSRKATCPLAPLETEGALVVEEAPE
jgi:hypothetical protein